jgi:hypothetical protein
MSDDLIDELAKDGVYDVSVYPEADRIREALRWVRETHVGFCDDVWEDPSLAGGLDCACGGFRHIDTLSVLEAENERLQEFLLGPAPEWEQANTTLKHRVREVEGQLADTREALQVAHDLLVGEGYDRDPDYRQEWQTISEALRGAEGQPGAGASKAGGSGGGVH